MDYRCIGWDNTPVNQYENIGDGSYNNPPLAEQRRIADILDTADAAIQQTEVLIAKLKLMRTGLLHDLLTCGLDENGNLRDPITHPDQFKDSPLGCMPREWNVAALGTVVRQAAGIIQTGPFGSQLHAEDYTQDGVPVIMPQDIVEGRINTTLIARTSAEKANSLSRHKVRPNDVVFARRGDLTRCVGIEGDNVGWLCGTGCLLLRASTEIIDGGWLCVIYQQDYCQRQVLARAVGTTMVNLNTSIIGSLHLAFPSIGEQRRIVRHLQSHDSQIRAEEAYCDKLKLIKQGLMDDLLTGRVRVPAEEGATA